MTSRDGDALPELSESAAEIHVLHVDDDPAFAEMAGEFLEREADRLTVTTETSAADGLAALADADCVVSDYRMPGANGLEFLADVREDYPDLPFVLFTGEGSEGLASEAVSAGVTDYFRKESGTDQFMVLANRIVDAVDRRRQQRALRRERDRFVTLFDEFTEPTLAYAYEDGEPHVRGVNAAFEDVFGYDSDGAVGEHVDDLVVPPGEREEAERIDERVRGGEHVDRELRRQTADGCGDFWFRNIQIHGDPDLDGFAVYADITERKERERELRRKIERLDEFASIVSHDLRNPLNVAQGRLELAREASEDRVARDEERPSDHASGARRERSERLGLHERRAGRAVNGPKAREQTATEGSRETRDDHLAAVERAHEQMERLVENLLALARHGETVEETDAVDLWLLAGACLETLGTDRAELRVADDVTVRADEDLLRRAIENLLRNAVEHGSTSPRSQAHEDAVEHGSTSPPSHAREDAVEHGSTSSRASPGVEPTVTVTVGALDDGFYVEDDGPGIPEEDRETVFESGYSTTADGTGFGLRIVSDVANAHDWTVGVTDGRNGGARFEFGGVETE